MSTSIPMPAAARRRAALPTTGSPIALRTDVSAWRVTSAAPAASYMRTDVLRSTDHNSIRTTGVVVPVPAGRGFGAAKQAAPPRGVPR